MVNRNVVGSLLLPPFILKIFKYIFPILITYNLYKTNVKIYQITKCLDQLKDKPYTETKDNYKSTSGTLTGLDQHKEVNIYYL